MASFDEVRTPFRCSSEACAINEKFFEHYTTAEELLHVLGDRTTALDTTQQLLLGIGEAILALAASNKEKK